jgi:hypothetical protein
MGPDVDVPGVGGVPKNAMIITVAAAAGFVGYAYYRRNKQRAAAAAAAAAAGPTDSGFNVSDGSGGTLPVVPGSALGGYGIPQSSNVATNPASITTNADWTDAVRTKLSGIYPDADLMAALGAFLQGQPLTSAQQTIIQSALAVAGYPPVGNLHILTGGGNTSMLVAPGNLRAVSVTDTGCSLVWDPVPGAAQYYLYEGTPHTGTTSDTRADVFGRQPGSTVGPFTVTAVSSSGQESPRSAEVTVQLSQPAPTPAPSPAPAPSPTPAPAPSGPRYPTLRTWHTNVRGDNYSKIAQQYGLNISGPDLYRYQLTPDAQRSPGAIAELYHEGPDLIQVGGSTAIPYNK